MIPDLQPGDLLLTRSPGAVGALIRFGERRRVHGWWQAIVRAVRVLAGLEVPEDPGDPCWVNHAAVCIGDGLIVEALAAGLTVSRADKYRPDGRIHVPLAAVRPGVTDADREALVRYAKQMCARHCSYGWLSIASIVLQLLTPTRLDVSWDGALICSAFAGQAWEHAGVILPTRSSLTTMPSDLAAMVMP